MAMLEFGVPHIVVATGDALAPAITAHAVYTGTATPKSSTARPRHWSTSAFMPTTHYGWRKPTKPGGWS